MIKQGKNYQAWHIRQEDFPLSASHEDKMKFLLRYAILAPSTHNSQPWRLSVDSNKVFFKPNLKRRLAIGDRENRFLYLSIGAALENFLIAAKHFGFTCVVKYPTATDNFVAVECSDGVRETGEDSLFNSIPQRCTYRAAFRTEELSPATLDALARKDMPDVHADIVADPEFRLKLAKIVAESTVRLMSTRSFRRELAGLVRSNVTMRGTGMPSFVMGIPTLPSLFVPFLFKLFNITKFQKKKAEGAQLAPAFGVISTTEDTCEAWVKAGQVFEHMALVATSKGVAVQPLVSPIHDGDCYKQIQAVLETSARPQFIFRVGFPGQAPALHTPRLTLEDVLD